MRIKARVGPHGAHLVAGTGKVGVIPTAGIGSSGNQLAVAVKLVLRGVGRGRVFRRGIGPAEITVPQLFIFICLFAPISRRHIGERLHDLNGNTALGTGDALEMPGTEHPARCAEVNRICRAFQIDIRAGRQLVPGLLVGRVAEDHSIVVKRLQADGIELAVGFQLSALHCPALADILTQQD